jgi:hypothetical protein
MPLILPYDTAPAPAIANTRDGKGSPRLPTGGGDDPNGREVVLRRHPDWFSNQIMWRRLLDSYEGGDRYRNAIYGYDRRGMPNRQLFRHQREIPDPQLWNNYMWGGYPNPEANLNAASAVLSGASGPYPGQPAADPAATVQDDIYETRRSRTPVPEWTSEACSTHLTKIYDQEVDRNADTTPEELVEWWENVDGAGTTIDEWMRETIGPLVNVLGTLDVCIDHPRAPVGVTIRSQADEKAYGLDKVIGTYFLPDNVVWWINDYLGNYIEVLIREYVDPSLRTDTDKNGNPIDVYGVGEHADEWRSNYVRWRLWQKDKSILYSFDGSEIIQRTLNPSGVIPIVRLIAEKNMRSKMIGKSTYQAVVGYQRAFYNVDSELILSDTLQATPVLCVPEEFVKSGQSIPVGAAYVMPMKHDLDKGGYTPPCYVAPQASPADALRKDKEDLRAAADRAACLSKPAGAETPGTVGQSGLSKQMDSHTGHKMLTGIAKTLQKCEKRIACLALAMRLGRELTEAEEASIVVTYPSKFDIADAAGMIDNTTKLQLIMGNCGKAPETEGLLLKSIVRQLLLGLEDEEYEKIDAELDQLCSSSKDKQDQADEMTTGLMAASARGAAATNGAASKNGFSGGADQAPDELGSEDSPSP